MSTFASVDWSRVPARQYAMRFLEASWYVVCPAFALLVGRTLYERVWLDLSVPWPWLADRPWLTLLVGGFYVGVHWWVVAWLLTADFPAEPWRGAVANRRRLRQGAVMLILLAVDYAPMTPWRWLMHALES